MPYVQYRYKGSLISHEKAARIGNLPAASQYLKTYYRDEWRGPSIIKSSGYLAGTSLDTRVAIEHDRIERQERIDQRRRYEEAAREREIERRLDYERRRIEEGLGIAPEPERPMMPVDYGTEEGPFIDIGGGPLEEEEFRDIDAFDLDIEWEVADIEEEDYP